MKVFLKRLGKCSRQYSSSRCRSKI